jgi:hypothetical protein
VLAFLILMLATIGVFTLIPFVSNHAFWFAIAAYVIRDWTFNTEHEHILIWVGLFSLLVAGFAVAAVFICIPIVSNYAYWFVIAAFMLRLFANIPNRIPQRVGGA